MTLPRPNLSFAALLHAGIMLLLASWYFGGNASHARTMLCWLGTPALLLTLLGGLQRLRSSTLSIRPLHWLWPLLAFDTMALASLATPNLRETAVEFARVLIPTPVSPLLPSSAVPADTLRSLWLVHALILPAYNLALLVHSRTQLRHFLHFAAVNTLLLAVLGTLQKLVHAPGLFFGAVVSPNATFFSTFTYHNHWGAFTVLSLAAGVGLLFHHLRQTDPRGFFHSPAFLLLVTTIFIGLSVPLSSSRSCTLLVLLLTLAAAALAFRRSSRPARIALVLCTAVSLGAAYHLAAPVIQKRLLDTSQQIEQARNTDALNSRLQLYRDTFQMGADRWLFGWGFSNYKSVFIRYNTQVAGRDGLPLYYEDAHSDWLQLFAETGLTGLACLLAGLLLPIASLPCFPRESLPRWLLAGSALLLAYAWVEFPFACPAVLLAFLLNYFIAIRLTQLSDS